MSLIVSFFLVRGDLRVIWLRFRAEEYISGIVTEWCRVVVADPDLLVLIVGQTNGQICSVVKWSGEWNGLYFPIGINASLQFNK